MKLILASLVALMFYVPADAACRGCGGKGVGKGHVKKVITAPVRLVKHLRGR